MNNIIRLTYFTPTFNRKQLLQNLYISLCNQTNKNFIWLIVDDGSNDDTKSEVEKWRDENEIRIEYYYKTNGGKHTAIDYANNVCSTEFICCVDSDDKLTKDATEVLYSKFDLCVDEDVCGLVGKRILMNKIFENKNSRWPIDNEKLFFDDLSKKYNFQYDTILVFKVDIAKNYIFPKIEDERFITESVYYNQFFYKYKLIAFEKEIYITKYMEDGYSFQGLKLFEKNPKGYAYALKQNACLSIEHKNSFLKNIKKSMYYYAWNSMFHLKNQIGKEMTIQFPYNFFGTVFMPIAKLYIKRKLKNGK